MDSYRRFYDVIRRIPWGRVATYGQVARAANRPGNARLVGYALRVLSDDSVPWHRVVNAQGKVSCRSNGSDRQRSRLEKEGIVFSRTGKISLRRFQWPHRATW